LRKIVPLYDYDRAKSTSAQAVNRLKRKFFIARRFAGANPELLFELFGYSRSAAYVTGGTQATSRFKAERFIEGSGPVYVNKGIIGFLG
jgi:hypothetical protein